MKKLFVAVFVFITAISHTSAQMQYEVIPDAEEGKVFKGIITRSLLETDTAMKWYAQNFNAYTPNAEGVQALKAQKDSIQLLVFMGTWCHDSHFIIPKFFNFTDAAGFSQDRITLIGVDRSKKTISHLTEALGIINVPTIMVMKNGKEVGRVVEYGKYGMFDKELGEIIRSVSAANDDR
jgi:hypothetical protein